MKYVNIFLVLFYSSAFAQDSRLFENDWYLTNVVVNGTDNFPPFQDMRILFDQQNASLDVNDGCNSLFGNTTFPSNSLTDFSFSALGITLLFCEDRYLYENLYFNVFTENSPADNALTYTITELNDIKTLTISSMFNKQAIYSSAMLSTIESKVQDFSIYPNPASDFINVKLNNQNFENTQIEIYNTLGKLCKSEKVVSSLSTIRLENLPSGIYLIKLISNNRISVDKIIIR